MIDWKDFIKGVTEFIGCLFGVVACIYAFAWLFLGMADWEKALKNNTITIPQSIVYILSNKLINNEWQECNLHERALTLRRASYLHTDNILHHDLKKRYSGNSIAEIKESIDYNNYMFEFNTTQMKQSWCTDKQERRIRQNAVTISESLRHRGILKPAREIDIFHKKNWYDDKWWKEIYGKWDNTGISI